MTPWTYNATYRDINGIQSMFPVRASDLDAASIKAQLVLEGLDGKGRSKLVKIVRASKDWARA